MKNRIFNPKKIRCLLKLNIMNIFIYQIKKKTRTIKPIEIIDEKNM